MTLLHVTTFLASGLLAAGSTPAGSKRDGKAATPGFPAVARRLAFASEGGVFLYDAAARTLAAVDLGELHVEEVDLSPDGTMLALTARASPDGFPKLFLADATGKNLRPVQTGDQGHHRSPRFSGCGEFVDFALSPGGHGGPRNPTRLRRLVVEDDRITEVGQERQCHFEPASVRRNLVAHVLTPCYLSFQLALTDLTTGKTRPVAGLTSASAEIAASPDKRHVVYTKGVSAGLGLFELDVESGASVLLASVHTDRDRIQPRFVTARRLVFLNSGKLWELDRKSRKVAELIAIPARLRAGEVRP